MREEDEREEEGGKRGAGALSFNGHTLFLINKASGVDRMRCLS